MQMVLSAGMVFLTWLIPIIPMISFFAFPNILPKILCLTLRAELDKLKREKADLQIDPERLMSYPDFDPIKRQLLNELKSGSIPDRFLAAEQLSQFYPQEACFAVALAENALSLMGFEEAIAASERLLLIVPSNSVARDL